MLADFEDEIFGEFSNRIKIEELDKQMAHIGWKYFSLRDLNELFATKVEEFGKSHE